MPATGSHAVRGPIAEGRLAFTLIEALVVLVIVSILMAFSYPKVSTMRAQLNVKSARDQIAQYFTIARATAINRARPAQVSITGNRITVTTTDDNGVTVDVVPTAAFDSLFSVTITASASTITYNARGLATGLGATQKFVVASGDNRDSVCVTMLGAMRRGCGP
jgi:prepilin-type N-terminal cleavage/methylation domain-containing protein